MEDFILMNDVEKIEYQIEELRKVLNNKILNNALPDEILNISCELDILIIKYINSCGK